MTEEEYFEKRREIDDTARAEKRKLVKEYGKQLVRFQVGDIIRDKLDRIGRIEKVVIDDGPSGRVFIQYEGERLKSTLKPYKCRLEFVTYPDFVTSEYKGGAWQEV